MEQNFLDIAIEASQKAGKLLLDLFGSKTEKTFKFDRSIVTEADLKADALITNIIKENFPNHSLLSEESGEMSKSSDYLWVIDPLDGSTNFSVHNPFFAVSIGLLEKYKPLLGVVYSPVQDELFVATRNEGAKLNGRTITVNKEGVFETSFLAFCNGRDQHSRDQMIRIYGELKKKNNIVRQVGAASLELCYVAAGRFGSFIMPGINPWDVMAGALIVNEANGLTTDFKNNPFNIKSLNLIASSSSTIHELLLQIIENALKGN